MQFSYRVSEAEYRRASKLRLNKGFGRRTLRTLMFWAFILVCLMMLWAIVQKNASRTSTDSTPVVTQSDHDAQTQIQDRTSTSHSLIANVGPFVLIAAVWLFMYFRMFPRSLRRRYLKDPAMQGEFTVDVTPASLGVKNTAGITAQNGWNMYESWREDKDVVMLLLKSGAYFILSVRELSEAERNELREVLSSVLPKN